MDSGPGSSENGIEAEDGSYSGGGECEILLAWASLSCLLACLAGVFGLY